MSAIIVIGAGINGAVAAIELAKRRHSVTLIEPGPVPHPLAASTDISKAVRAAYGDDEIYSELSARAIPLWRKWNSDLDVELYHEVGVLFLRQRSMQPGDFEFESLRVLERHGCKIERIDSEKLRARFPAWNAERYSDGILELEAGYVESGRVVTTLIDHARSLGVKLREGQFAELDQANGRVFGVILSEVEESRGKSSRQAPPLGMTRVAADAVVMAVGAWTPYVLPFAREFFRATGQPVFHLKPRNPQLFTAEQFPVFGADISTTGYYGFPLNRDGVVKIANHGTGREMSPDSPDRAVTEKEENDLREFLGSTFPALADAPIVYTRRCFYCDTHDGNFWIARDPERDGLTIAAGDCGHGFKFAPVLGQIIADSVEGKENPLLKKFRWRPEIKFGENKEAARAEIAR